MNLVRTTEFYESDLLNVELEVYKDELGELWFHGATLCNIFELKNPTLAIQRHVDDDWRKQFPGDRGRQSWYVTEPGFYQLLHASKHPAAKRFQRWVYFDVVPKLRASGYYLSPNATSEQLKGLRNKVESLLLDLDDEKKNTLLAKYIGKYQEACAEYERDYSVANSIDEQISFYLVAPRARFKEKY